jgi:hypothetical protein
LSAKTNVTTSEMCGGVGSSQERARPAIRHPPAEGLDRPADRAEQAWAEGWVQRGGDFARKVEAVKVLASPIPMLA